MTVKIMHVLMLIFLGAMTTSCQLVIVKVIDFETGEPIKKAECSFSMKAGNPFTPSYGRKTKYTNKNGKASAVIPATVHFSGVNAEASGYYSSWTVPKSGFPESKIIKLRPVKKPIKSERQEFSSKIPVWDKDLGLDLFVGDWLPPHGKGKVADLIVRGTLNFKDKREYEGHLSLSFPNKYDGMYKYDKEKQFKSEFILPYLANQDGYKNKLHKESVSTPDPHSSYGADRSAGPDRDQVFIFRIRSKEEDDKFKDANHGIIWSDIGFWAGGGLRGDTPGLRIEFYYSINKVDRTPNIEMERGY